MPTGLPQYRDLQGTNKVPARAIAEMPGAMAVARASDELAMMKKMKKEEKKRMKAEKRKRDEEEEEEEKEEEVEESKSKKTSKKSQKEAREQEAEKEDQSDDEASKKKRKKKKEEKKKKKGGDAEADEPEPKADKASKEQKSSIAGEEKDKDRSKKKRKEGKSEKSQQGSDEEEAFRASLHISLSGGGEHVAPSCVRSLDGSPFSKSIVKAMKDAGFTSPSPIQSQAWPIASAGYDMVAVAKTGSGKTLGFLLPAFSYLEKLGGGGGRGCKVLVLAPTRELAIQIESECKKFGKEAQATCCCLYGGVPVGPQKSAMKQDPKIVIATPGRLVDLMSQDSCDISKCGYVVLDEADRMLDMGFEPQIKKVFDALPPVEARQTLFFTATW